MDWKAIVHEVLPIVVGLKAPKLIPYVPVIEHGMIAAEDLAHAKGTDKLAHAVTLTADALEAVNVAKGRQVIDPALIRTVGAEAIALTADVAKLIQLRGLPAQVTGTTLPLPQ